MPPFFVADIIVLSVYMQTNDWGAISRLSYYLSLSLSEIYFMTDTMAKHRAKSLSTLLWTALSTGFAETEPQLIPLKVP
jgi:hypothetical protein